MGSSFCTSNNTSPKYDAFLSFRGVDTRNSFRCHLKYALCEKGIKTFTDDENMEVGEDIHPQLLKAIKESRSSIIILSPAYASSKWCLYELVQILDSKKTMGQIVAPIFYRVRRSDVRDLTGVFGDGFSQREQDRDSQRWREALRYVAELPGNELQDGDEAEFVRDIVGEVSRKLNSVASSDVERVDSYLRTWHAAGVDNLYPPFFFFFGSNITVLAFVAIRRTMVGRHKVRHVCRN